MSNSYFKTALASVVLAGVTALAATPPTSPQGVIAAKAFLNINGTAVADLTGNAKFPNSPDVVNYPAYFELNATGNIATAPPNWADNYGAQMIGYFYPPTTGDYVFFISADDTAALYLSTDGTAANKKLIAQETVWSNPRQYNASGGASDLNAKDSSLFAATQWPVKDPTTLGAKITLTQGQPYYIEALMKEGGGGDNLSVAAWDVAGNTLDTTQPIPGEYLSSYDKTTGPLSIVTHPQGVTVDEGQPATFAVVVDGTPPYTYQWRSNTVDIAGATGPSYTINRAYRSANLAIYSVVVTGAQGPSLTSNGAQLTVNNDTVAPTLVLAQGTASFDTVTVTFSEPVDPASAQTASNYKISGGISVSAAVLGAPAGTAGDNRVVLTTSTQTQGTTLTLTVNDVKDAAGNAIAAGSTIDFKTFVLQRGWASFTRWNNENGDPGTLEQIAQAIAGGTIRAPDFSSAYQQFGGPWGLRDDYGAKVSGWFIPPSDGNYVFFLSSDDGSYLYLSTDDKPANKKLIAYESGWSNQYQWQTIGGGSTAADKRSDTFSNTTTWEGWPDGWTISLKANQPYYIEIVHDEGTGGDGSDATFIKEGEGDPAQNATGMFLKGDVIATYLDPTGASITIAQPPQDATQQELRTATFSVTATGTSAYGTTVSYQWQRMAPGAATWTDIANATAATYTTPILQLADSTTKYRVLCSVPTLVEFSAAATLTVVPDTFPPMVLSAGSVMKGTAIEVGVGFDENVDPVSAGTAANYTLSKGTVTGVRYQKYAHTDGAGFFVVGSAGPFYGADVVLTTSGLAAGDTVTVTVKNVKDIKGNPMSATGESKGLIVTSKMKWAAVGGNDYLEQDPANPVGIAGGWNPDPALWPDDVVAVGAADFDLISSGTQNWDAYDELTFVYEEVTGDFDKVVRIEYQDPMSQWARAGLMATPALDEGVTRAEVTGGYQMERRMRILVDPAVQWNGTAGNNQNESAWRLTKGGNYAGSSAGNPAYPNAWLRLQRAGQAFSCLYSADGKNWTSWTGTTFTDEPMPDTLYVGMYYSPEMNNNGTGQGVGHSSVAKFRQYGSYVAKPSEVQYGIGLNFAADEYYTGDPAVASNAGTLPSIGTAGVPGVIQGNWNNLKLAASTAPVALVADSKGSALPTTATVEWTSPNTWASTGRGEENNPLPGNDKILMTGYVDTGAATTTTVTITGLPADLTAKGYDVYVYFLGGVAAKGGGYVVTDANDTLLTEWILAECPVNPTAHVEAVPPTPGGRGMGTYVVFKGLTAANIKVLASTADGRGFGTNPRAPINAIQLVPTGGGPKPPGDMMIAVDGATITIDWEGDGMLQSATKMPTVPADWKDVGTTKPYTTAPTAGPMFYRVKGQ